MHFTLFLLFPICILSSQGLTREFEGSVKEQGSDKVIPYALVTNRNRSFGLHTDEMGNFHINNLTELDTIFISAIGYYPLAVPLEEFKHTRIIRLAQLPNRQPVNERDHKTHFSKPIKIGPDEKKEDGSFGGAMQAGDECAVFLANAAAEKGVIKDVGVYILAEGIFSTPFRIRIYNNNNGAPGEELTTQSVVLKARQKGKWNRFEVLNLGLVFPENGCFIAMEWLNWGDSAYNYHDPASEADIKYGQCIGMVTNLSSGPSYFRTINSPWETWEKRWGIENGSNLASFVPTKIMETRYTPMINVRVLY